MTLIKLAGLLILLCMTSAWAVEPFTVRDIRVEGIQRTEAGTVFSYLPIKVGDIMDNKQATAAIHALYATGFFKDVLLKV
ncbi:MAG: POTRA domain-containing protein, partial [Gallionella sp.]